MVNDDIAENVLRNGKDGVKQNMIQVLEEFVACYADEMWQIVSEVIKLREENAALRERLEKAVEFPCKLGDKLFYVNEYYKIPKIEEHTVTAFTLLSKCTQLHVESGGYFLTDTKNVFFDRAEAEVRLAELKREK